MASWNKVSYMVKISTFNINLTFNIVLHDLFSIIYDTYDEVWKSKTTINNKDRAIEQKCGLDPVN